MIDQNNIVGSDGELLTPQPVPKIRPQRPARMIYSWLFWLAVLITLATYVVVAQTSLPVPQRVLVLIGGILMAQTALAMWIILSAVPVGARKKTPHAAPQTIEIPPDVLVIHPHQLPLIRNKRETRLSRLGSLIFVGVMMGVGLAIWRAMSPVAIDLATELSWWNAGFWWAGWLVLFCGTGIAPLFLAAAIHSVRRHYFILQHGEIRIARVVNVSAYPTNKIPKGSVSVTCWYEIPLSNRKTITRDFGFTLSEREARRYKEGMQVAVLYVNRRYFFLV